MSLVITSLAVPGAPSRVGPSQRPRSVPSRSRPWRIVKSAPFPSPSRHLVPYLVSMLEPRGADSSASFDSATDVSAREVIQARNAMLQGRIADALDLVDAARHDQVLTEDRRGDLALTGLLCRLARGDLRGAAPFARDMSSLVRVRGPVAARACYGLGEFAAARGKPDQAVSYFESAGVEPVGPDGQQWLPWRSGLARILAGRGDITTAAALVEEELVEARIVDSPYAIASALRTLSAVASTDRRLSLLEEALGVLIGVGAARLEAQIRTD